jgi:hypothetical protein
MSGAIERNILGIFMTSVVMLCVVMLSAVALNVTILSIAALSVVMPRAVLFSLPTLASIY